MPAGTVLHNRPDTSSMGGTDICVYSIVGANIYVYSIVGTIGAPIRQKGPHMPLASIVGTRIHHTWYMWWGSSYTNSISHVPTSTLPEEANASPNLHLTFYNDINSVMRANHHHYPHSAWATRLRNIRTLSLSPVKPSPLSIKGDALPPTKEIDFPEVHFFKLRLTRSIAEKPLKHTLEHLVHSRVPVALGPFGRTRPGLSYTPPFSSGL